MRKESLNWFQNELRELQTPFVNLHIYVSQETSTPNDSSSVELGTNGDMEQGKVEDSRQYSVSSARKGRPDVASLVNECLSQPSLSQSQQRIGVGACGPARLLDATKEAVMNPAHDNGPFITLHTEV